MTQYYWSDDRVEQLKQLWQEGLSASQVAGALGGVSRSAVIGKVHRLGLAARNTTSRSTRSYTPRLSGKTYSSAGEVSVGSPGAERQITNVAPGSAPTDAANVEQVEAAMGNAEAYSNTLFDKAGRQIWSVAAAAAAFANLPQAPSSGQTMVGISMGMSHGEMGMAFGGSYMPDDNMVLRASASYSGEAGMTAGMGLGFVLN